MSKLLVAIYDIKNKEFFLLNEEVPVITDDQGAISKTTRVQNSYYADISIGSTQKNSVR